MRIYKPPVIPPHKTAQERQAERTAAATFHLEVERLAQIQVRPQTLTRGASKWKFTLNPSPDPRASAAGSKSLLYSLPAEILQHVANQDDSELLSNMLSSTSRDFAYLRGHGIKGARTVDEHKIDIFFRALSRGCWDLSGLKSLTLRSNQLITGAQLKLLPSALTDLTIQGGKLAKITPEDLSWVPRGQLTLHEVTFVDHVTFPALLSHPSASRLLVKNVQLEAPYRLGGPVEADFESAVTELGFEDCDLTATSLPFLLSLGGHITLLALNQNQLAIEPQTPAAAQLVELFQMPSLRALHFCEPLVNIAVLARSLETTTVENLTLGEIADIPVSTLLRNNAHLKSLNLSNIAIQQNQLTDIKRIPNLTELDLRNCGLADACIAAIAGDGTHNKTLQWIDLRNNPLITEGVINALCSRALQLSVISDTFASAHVFGTKLDKINKALSEPSPQLQSLVVDLLRNSSPHDLRKFPVYLPGSITSLTIAFGNISFLPDDFLQTSSVTHFTARAGRLNIEALVPLMRSKVRDLTFENCQLTDSDLQTMAETSSSNAVAGRFLNVSNNPGITPQGRDLAIHANPLLSLRQGGYVALQADGIRRLVSGDLLWNDDTVSDLKLIYRKGTPILSGRIPLSTRNLDISCREVTNAPQSVPPDAPPPTMLALTSQHFQRLLPRRNASVETISLSNIMLDSDAFFAVADRSQVSSLTLAACHLDYHEFEDLGPYSLDYLKRLNADGDTLNADAVIALARTFPTLSIYTPTHARMTGDEAERFFSALLETPEKYQQLRNLVLNLDPRFELQGAQLVKLPQSLTALTIHGGVLKNLQDNGLAGVKLNHFPSSGTATPQR